MPDVGCVLARTNGLPRKELPDDREDAACVQARALRPGEKCVLGIRPENLQLQPPPGDVLPLDRGAAGKILRSFADEADPSLDAVRRQGWAFSDGERDPSCAALAAPVFGMGHELIGAISLSGPRERFTKQTIASMTKLLLDSAAELSRLAINDARARAVSGPPATSAR